MSRDVLFRARPGPFCHRPVLARVDRTSDHDEVHVGRLFPPVFVWNWRSSRDRKGQGSSTTDSLNCHRDW